MEVEPRGRWVGPAIIILVAVITALAVAATARPYVTAALGNIGTAVHEEIEFIGYPAQRP